MKIILLSGGAGKRLWPLSHPSLAKPFLPGLFQEGGQTLSLLQLIWTRLQQSVMSGDVLISTHADQASMVKLQLGDGIPIIEEPETRDTFPAMCLAAAYLNSELKARPDEPVLFLPTDIQIDATFLELVHALGDEIALAEYDLFTIGVRPRRACSRYGYLRIGLPNPDGSRTIPVNSFKEKPAKADAERYIGEGALWNSGVFGCKLSFLLEQLEQRALPSDYPALCAAYSRLPKRSFDIEVAQQTSKIAALPYHGAWEDLGTWQSVLKARSYNSMGPYIADDASSHSVVMNATDRPVLLVGLDHVLVSVSEEGILVCKLDDADRIKPWVEQIEKLKAAGSGSPPPGGSGNEN